MSKMRKNVCGLSKLRGISSREEDVIDYMENAFLEIHSDVSVDILGNVICRFESGKNNAKRIVVFAHTDELGMIVRKIEQNGFLRFMRVGGVNVNVLPGTKVDIIGKLGVIPGIIGIKSHHLTKPEEKGVLPSVDEMYIDVGATSAVEVEEIGIHTGCFITFASVDVIELGKNRLCGKAMDDRSCCAILIELVKEVNILYEEKGLNWDVYIVACVQEEFNVRGIMPAINAIRPNASIGLDICIAADTPDLAGYSEIVLGGGPALTYLNFHGRGTLAGVLPDKKLLEALENICDLHNIRFQREVIIGLVTENAFISFQNEGVPVANISLPCRYSHTAVETVDERDMIGVVHLVSKFIMSLETNTCFGKFSKHHT